VSGELASGRIVTEHFRILPNLAFAAANSIDATVRAGS
jgi:hypothetical protein